MSKTRLRYGFGVCSSMVQVSNQTKPWMATVGRVLNLGNLRRECLSLSSCIWLKLCNFVILVVPQHFQVLVC